MFERLWYVQAGSNESAGTKAIYYHTFIRNQAKLTGSVLKNCPQTGLEPAGLQPIRPKTI